MLSRRAGFIGSHTNVFAFRKRILLIYIGFIYDIFKIFTKVSLILSEKDLDTKEKIFLIEGDIKNEYDIERVFKMSFELNKRIESIHFAGLKSVADSVKNPRIYWDNNVNGTINLLKIMEKYNCRTIVFSSSATVYKAKSNQSLFENDICEPANPYGTQKLTIEKILKIFSNSDPSQWRIASLRYFNPVGAHESGLIGEDVTGKPNNIYPRINTGISYGRLKQLRYLDLIGLQLMGRELETMYVMDLAEGHFAALIFNKSKPQFLTLNLVLVKARVFWS